MSEIYPAVNADWSSSTIYKNPVPYGHPKVYSKVQFHDGREFIGGVIPYAAAATYDLTEGAVVVCVTGGVTTTSSGTNYDYPEIVGITSALGDAAGAVTTGKFIIGVCLRPFTYGTNIDSDRWMWIQTRGDCYARVVGNASLAVGSALQANEDSSYGDSFYYVEAAGTLTNDATVVAYALEAYTTTTAAALKKVRLKGVATYPAT